MCISELINHAIPLSQSLSTLSLSLCLSVWVICLAFPFWSLKILALPSVESQKDFNYLNTVPVRIPLVSYAGVSMR